MKYPIPNRKLFASLLSISILASLSSQIAQADDLDDDLAKLKKTYPQVEITRANLGTILSFSGSDFEKNVNFQLKKTEKLFPGTPASVVPKVHLSEIQTLRFGPLSYLLYFGKRATIQTMIDATLQSINRSTDSEEDKLTNRFFFLETVAQTLLKRMKPEWVITFSMNYISKYDQESGKILMQQLIKTLVQNGDGFLLNCLYTSSVAHQNNKGLYIYRYQPNLSQYIQQHRIIDRVTEELLKSYFKALDGFKLANRKRRETNDAELKLEKAAATLEKARTALSNYVSFYTTEAPPLKTAANATRVEIKETWTYFTEKAIDPNRVAEIQALYDELHQELLTDKNTVALIEKTKSYMRPAEQVKEAKFFIPYTKNDEDKDKKESLGVKKKRKPSKPNQITFGKATIHHPKSLLSPKGYDETRALNGYRGHPLPGPKRRLDIYMPGSPIAEVPKSPTRPSSPKSPSSPRKVARRDEPMEGVTSSVRKDLFGVKELNAASSDTLIIDESTSDGSFDHSSDEAPATDAPAAAAPIPATATQVQQQPQYLKHAGTAVLPVYEFSDEIQSACPIAALIMQPQINEERAARWDAHLARWLQKNREDNNFCKINEESIPVAILLIQQKRFKLLKEFVTLQTTVCDLNQFCKEGKTIREAVMNDLISKEDFKTVFEFMGIPQFAGTPVQKAILLDMIGEYLALKFREGTDLRKYSSVFTSESGILVSAQLFERADAKKDNALMDLLVNSDLIK
jgi:hypothetical protein